MGEQEWTHNLSMLSSCKINELKCEGVHLKHYFNSYKKRESDLFHTSSFYSKCSSTAHLIIKCAAKSTSLTAF